MQVLEALQHGLVVVTTAVGIEGIASAESFPGYVATAQVGDGMTFFSNMKTIGKT